MCIRDRWYTTKILALGSFPEHRMPGEQYSCCNWSRTLAFRCPGFDHLIHAQLNLFTLLNSSPEHVSSTVGRKVSVPYTVTVDEKTIKILNGNQNLLWSFRQKYVDVDGCGRGVARNEQEGPKCKLLLILKTFAYLLSHFEPYVPYVGEAICAPPPHTHTSRVV